MYVLTCMDDAYFRLVNGFERWFIGEKCTGWFSGLAVKTGSIALQIFFCLGVFFLFFLIFQLCSFG